MGMSGIPDFYQYCEQFQLVTTFENNLWLYRDNSRNRRPLFNTIDILNLSSRIVAFAIKAIRLNPPISEYTKGLEDFLVNKFKPKSMTIIYENSMFGTVPGKWRN